MPIITCPSCGARNRVKETLAPRRQPICGRCGAHLSPDAGDVTPREVSDATIADLLREAGDRPVLVDCWAAWCGPCRMIAPTIDQLAAESAGRWVIAKLDVDQNPRTATQFRIDSIPALLLFKNGQLVEKLVGLQPREAIQTRLEASV